MKFKHYLAVIFVTRNHAIDVFKYRRMINKFHRNLSLIFTVDNTH